MKTLGHLPPADGERVRRGAAWVLATGVAAIAAIVSYSHIYDLGREYGGSYTAARLLPLSVDMLILVGELMLLHEGDTRGNRFAVGWVLVWSGIAATMAANVTFGAQYGPVGAILWGWPAYSFILVAAGMVAMVRRAGGAQPPHVSQAPPAPVPSGVQDSALRAQQAAIAAGNPYTPNKLVTNFRLTRAEATKVCELAVVQANGHLPAGEGR